MPPPKDLPGFYYDAEKNRYFPTKGLFPGSKRTSSSALASCSSPSKESKIQVTRNGKRIKISQLISLREIQGRNVFFNSRKYRFDNKYREMQASQPTVWKFEGTNYTNSGIERIFIPLHTQTGSRDALVLATGSTNGTLSFFEVDNPRGYHLNVTSVWSPLWRSGTSSSSHDRDASLSFHGSLSFPSEISCIKRRGDSTHALVTTLGSGVSKGSLYYLDVKAISNVSETASWTVGSGHILSLDGTVWTAHCNPAGTHAALGHQAGRSGLDWILRSRFLPGLIRAMGGTNMGSALVDLETRSLQWIYRSKSDVLSQQFVSAGNVVLCGLRNGLILTVDTRERQIGHEQDVSRLSTAPNPRTMNLTLSRRERRRNFIRPQVERGQRSSSHVRMTSAVCSLVSLLSDENYFLASSMDGLIKLFDIRALRNGGVQSYEGHVNSHSRLQLAVNPSEMLLLSGGEDCRARIWSIKSGELLFSEIFSKSCFTTVLWRDLQGYAGDRFDRSQNCGAWLGSRDGLYYMQSI